MIPEALSVVTFEFQHILPSSLGGATSIENLCLSCPTCNRYQSDRTFGAGNEQTRMTALFHPHLEAWNDHFSWSEDATELIGLTPTGMATTGLINEDTNVKQTLLCDWRLTNLGHPAQRFC